MIVVASTLSPLAGERRKRIEASHHAGRSRGHALQRRPNLHGSVKQECGAAQGHVNTPPFGNWCVETESTLRKDGHQFQGWCNDASDLCDNIGECRDYSGDDWYERNSCTTTLPRYNQPNNDFYNHEGGTKQWSEFDDANIHGRGSMHLVVSCPPATNGDYHADESCYDDVLAIGFSRSGHPLALWVLDHASCWDDKIGTLRFPMRSASLSVLERSVYDCSEGRDGPYRSKAAGSTSAVSAAVTIQIKSALFRDELGNCCGPLSDPGCVH